MPMIRMTAAMMMDDDLRRHSGPHNYYWQCTPLKRKSKIVKIKTKTKTINESIGNNCTFALAMNPHNYNRNSKYSDDDDDICFQRNKIESIVFSTITATIGCGETRQRRRRRFSTHAILLRAARATISTKIRHVRP